MYFPIGTSAMLRKQNLADELEGRLVACVTSRLPSPGIRVVVVVVGALFHGTVRYTLAVKGLTFLGWRVRPRSAVRSRGVHSPQGRRLDSATQTLGVAITCKRTESCSITGSVRINKRRAKFGERSDHGSDMPRIPIQGEAHLRASTVLLRVQARAPDRRFRPSLGTRSRRTPRQ